MEKQTPESVANREPPPYSEVAPPIQTIPIPVYSPNPQVLHHHHLGPYGPESVLRTHVITQQPGATIHVVTSSQLFGPDPKIMVCRACNQTMSSKIIQEPSIRTHVLAISLCMLGCWPCVPCVYCTDCCMNVNHYCSVCDAYQGTFIAAY